MDKAGEMIQSGGIVGPIILIGANGFIGTHLLRELSLHQNVEIRAVVRKHILPTESQAANIKTYTGNLLQPESLWAILSPGCTVINLAYLREADQRANLEAIENLAQACVRARVKRLVHCSTVMVFGNSCQSVIDEDAPCFPKTKYEVTKLAVENKLLDGYQHQFELAILRPAAVFGPNGKNLLKLADDLSNGSRIANYLKSCLSHSRRMNLVSVANVVAAILFLADTNRPLAKSVYIISDDDNRNNTYPYIEQYLMRKLGIPPYAVPPLLVPSLFLHVLLKLLGNPHTNTRRVYQGKNLAAAGFVKPVKFEAGLDSFVDWYRGSF